ncbi:fructose operon transcriptional repressor [Spiroplasma chinense]|uniref:Fructose operon transcriptional repressor n=1 Tax=Spiroplasma chinense TaxID=216932 RepID=A0A5B9Y6B2_9MOLU|nr:DeoR/GlpR family DNA-binding transcription regulator [Spiroplasma chinense]QEH62266.1 fructose operon transcriptional repressor [Spiroplasma chinense]
MKKANNQLVILETIRQLKNPTFKELQQKLDIPESTIRRILTNFERSGKVVKDLGMYQIVAQPLVRETPYYEKTFTNIDKKKEIAMKAFYCIKDGESVFLDGGTTIDFLADLLEIGQHLNIVTNSIPIFLKLFEKGFKDIVLIGGNYNATNQSLVGFGAVDFIEKYNFDVSFLEVSSVDNEYNCYTTSVDDCQIKQRIIEKSKFCFALADETKFNKKSFIKFGSKKDVIIISE